MGISTELLKANRVGVRDLKEHLSTKLLSKVLIVTYRGNPVSVNLPYSDVMELTDIIDELSDKETLLTINEGRKSIKEGSKGVPVHNLFSKIRK